jgi:glutamate N-acetyltransferase/amino-acid N-acetyltransferase
MLQKALSSDVANTFNMVSVDGDTSTNDMVTVLANGMAGNAEICEENADFEAFMQALNTVTVYLCRKIAGDGEGATKLLECRVTGAADVSTAKTVAKSVICSSLLKAAMFGADANWGRVLCAIGYSGAGVDVHKVDVSFRSAKGEIKLPCMVPFIVPIEKVQANDYNPNEVPKSEMELLEQSIRQTVRNVDVVTRYNRQQFLVILVGTDPEGVRIAMDRIIRGYYKMTGSGAFTPTWTIADT